MKKYFLIGVGSLLLFVACKTAKNKGTTNSNSNHQEPAPTISKAFIPHSPGSYWAYENTNYKSGQSSSMDTLKVLSSEQTPEGIKVDLNHARWMVKAKGDSIWVRCRGRGGGEFLQPLYHRTEGEGTFSTCKGDVLFQASVSKLKNPMEVNGKSYNNCYRYQITANEVVFVADGIGIIRREYYDINQKLYLESNLLNYFIAKDE